MASRDPPKRRAEPLAATDSATDVDTSVEATARRGTDLMPGRGGRPKTPTATAVDELEAGDSTRVSPAPESVRASDKRPKRRGDTPAAADELRQERQRTEQRSTEIFMDNPDVVGAPERTVVVPLPPHDEQVDPLPQARAATRSDDEHARPADSERSHGRTRVDERPKARAREHNRDRDGGRRREQERGRERHRDNQRGARDTQDEDRERDSVPKRRPRRDDPGRVLARKTTEPVHLDEDSPWRRLRVAAGDILTTSVLAVKHHWHVLSTRGPRPYLDAARPQAQRAWLFVRHWALKARLVAVKGAVRVGLVKPRRLEYELESSDRVDRARADAWRRFHDGRKSSSYLQDDE